MYKFVVFIKSLLKGSILNFFKSNGCIFIYKARKILDLSFDYLNLMNFWYIFVKIYCDFIFKRILLCCKSGKFLVFYKKHFEKICNFILFIFQIFKLFVIWISLDKQVTAHSKSESLLSKTASSFNEEFSCNPWELSTYVPSSELVNISDPSKLANSSCCALFFPKLKVKTSTLFENVIKKNDLGNNVIEYDEKYWIRCLKGRGYYKTSIWDSILNYFELNDYDHILIYVAKKDFSGNLYLVEKIGIVNLLNDDLYVDRDSLTYWQPYAPIISKQAAYYLSKENTIDQICYFNAKKDYIVDCIEISWADLKKSDVIECVIVVASLKKNSEDEAKILQKVADVKVVYTSTGKVVDVNIDYTVLEHWKLNAFKITDQAFNLLNTKEDFQIWWEYNKWYVEYLQKLHAIF